MAVQYVQQTFPFIEDVWPSTRDSTNVISSDSNAISPEDRRFHDWYRFVLSYPPHLVRDYIKDFGLDENTVLLDPFCGTGTTVVEGQLHKIETIGIEANPFPHFASCVKTNWSTNPELLETITDEIEDSTYSILLEQGIDDRALVCAPNASLKTLNAHAQRAIITNSISPIPLHKSLVLLEQLNRFENTEIHKYAVLALGSALVANIGNLRFGPEVGVGKIKTDTHVISAWKHEIQKMVGDLRRVQDEIYPESKIHLADSRNIQRIINPETIDAVITSPPYPNEKDYTRTTRLESVILGFFSDMAQIRTHKKQLVRSNTRGVYKIDNDDLWVAHNPRIQKLACDIENRRVELGKTSGFEKLYARVTKLYFGGMARHLSELSAVLKPGAMLAYVVGDQASYLRIMIRTGQILAEIAEQLGYEVERIDLFRTRFATATLSELREEVVILRWPGKQ